jgi:deoxyribose-phosphate aldolase
VSDSIVRFVDHALLHPTLTDSQLIDGCDLARRLHVASVCIKPWAVSLAAEALATSPKMLRQRDGLPVLAV